MLFRSLVINGHLPISISKINRLSWITLMTFEVLGRIIKCFVVPREALATLFQEKYSDGTCTRSDRNATHRGDVCLKICVVAFLCGAFCDVAPSLGMDCLPLCNQPPPTDCSTRSIAQHLTATGVSI